MQVHTSRFGSLQVPEDRFIVFPQGLIGLESIRQWLLVADPQGGELAWLQAATAATQALPVIRPRRFVPGYRVLLSRRELAPLKFRAGDRTCVLTLVSQAAGGLVANLRAPLVINVDRRIGRQIITSDNQPLRYPLPSESTARQRAA
jgi:flagellar assembly factor FliW